MSVYYFYNKKKYCWVCLFFSSAYWTIISQTDTNSSIHQAEGISPEA